MENYKREQESQKEDYSSVELNIPMFLGWWLLGRAVFASGMAISLAV